MRRATAVRSIILLLAFALLATAGVVLGSGEGRAQVGGSISGVVNDAQGNPLEGCHVDANSLDNDAWSGEGQTDENGWYQVTGLNAGDYMVDAVCSGYVREYFDGARNWGGATTIAIVEGQNTPNIDFSLDIGGTISGIVTDANGNPLQDCAVKVESQSASRTVGGDLTAADGTYSFTGLSTGNYRVEANCYYDNYISEYFDNVRNWYEATRIAVVEGQDTPGINFSLNRAGTISGVVTDAPGNPIEGCSVHANIWDGSDSSHRYTDEAGWYQITDLAPGDYRVDVYCSGYVGEYFDNVRNESDATPVSVADGQVTDGIDFSLDVGGSISGIVTDAQGNPLEDCDVYAYPWDYGNTSGDRWTDVNGTYTIPGLATGDYVVEVDCDGYLSEYYDDARDQDDATPVAVVEGQDTSDIDFSLGTGGIISGVVTDAQGNPIKDCRVYAGPLDNGDTWGYVWTYVDGTYAISGLATGDYRVQVECYDDTHIGEYYNNTRDWNDATPVSVVEGQNTTGINFELSVGGTISGVVSDAQGNPLQGCYVGWAPWESGGTWGSDYTGEDGTYAISGLATDSYRVHVQCIDDTHVDEYYNNARDSNDATPVSVVEGQNTTGIDFIMDIGGTISGVVTDTQGNPIGDCHVHADRWDGDYILVSGGHTDEDGSYTITRLATDDYRVQVDCNNHNYISEYYDDARDWDDATPVSVVEGQNTPNIDFSMDTGGTISGVVTDTQGNPIEGCDVYADPWDDGDMWGWDYTGVDGTYTITGLTTNSYRVEADCYSDDYFHEYYDNVRDLDDATPVGVIEGMDTPDIDFSMDIGGYISGVVTDAQGNPIEGCWAMAIPDDGSDWRLGLTDQDGRYTINLLESGDYPVEVLCDGYLVEYYDDVLVGDPEDATPVSVVEGQETAGIDFSLIRGGSISGIVTDPAGYPVQNVRLVATDGDVWQSAYTDVNGVYELQDLPPRDYLLRAEGDSEHIAEYYDGARFQDDATQVAVGEAEQIGPLNFVLEEGGSATGLVTDSAENILVGVQVCAEPEDSRIDVRCVTSGPTGGYRLSGLAGGSYKIHACLYDDLCQYYDGVEDAADATPLGIVEGQEITDINFSLNVDADSDGVQDASDNCPLVPNPDQTNSDYGRRPNGAGIAGDWASNPAGDSMGDACDPDSDNDGLVDASENASVCPFSSQGDSDGDRIGDGYEVAASNNACDIASKPTCDGIPYTDSDGDGLSDCIEHSGYNTCAFAGDTTPGWTDCANPADSDGDGCADTVEIIDVNGSRTVDIADQLWLARRMINLIPPSDSDAVFDLTKNGYIDIADQLLMARNTCSLRPGQLGCPVCPAE